MRKTLLTILLGSLLSCQSGDYSGPTYFQGEQCSPQLIAGPSDNPETFIPVCRCRQYRIDRNRVGPVLNENGRVTVIRRAIEKCNLVKGYVPAEDTRFVNTMDAWRVEIKKRTKSSKSLTMEGEQVGPEAPAQPPTP